MSKKEKTEKREKKEKIRKPIDKKKLIQTVVIIIICLAMVVSFAASLIYSIIYS